MPDQLPDPLFFLVGFLSLVSGRLFSYLDEPEDYPAVQSPASRNITHYAMIILFFIFACAWFFEAMGTARVAVVGDARAEAISFYIRCAIYLDKVGPAHGAITAAVVALLAFVTGHWLWADHPAVRRKKNLATAAGPTTT